MRTTSRQGGRNGTGGHEHCGHIQAQFYRAIHLLSRICSGAFPVRHPLSYDCELALVPLPNTLGILRDPSNNSVVNTPRDIPARNALATANAWARGTLRNSPT